MFVIVTELENKSVYNWQLAVTFNFQYNGTELSIQTVNYILSIINFQQF